MIEARWSKVLIAAGAWVSAASGQSPAVDAYGDPLPPGAVARMGTVRFRHFGPVMAFAPDGKTLTTGTGDAIRFWDATTGKLVRETPVPSWGRLHPSPDGKLLATAGGRGVQLLDPATNRVLRTIPAVHEVLAFSPDCRILATCATGGEVFFWDPATAKPIRTLPDKGDDLARYAYTVAGRFTADGATFVAASEHGTRIRRWDVKTGEALASPKVVLPRSKLVQISPDALSLAVSSETTGAVSVWDTKTGQERFRLEEAGAWGRPRTLAFTRDSRTLIVPTPDLKRGETVLTLSDVQTGQERRRLTLPAVVFDVHLAPDDRTLLTKRASAFAVWDLTSGKRLAGCEGHDGEIRSLAFTPDGRRLVSASTDGTVRSWDAITGKQEAIVARLGGAQTFVPAADSQTVVVGGDGELLLHELATGKVLRRLEAPEGAPAPAALLGGTPDGRWALAHRSKGSENWLQVWDLAKGEAVSHRHDRKLTSAPGAFSPDARWFVGSGLGAPAVLSEVATGRERMTLPLPDTAEGDYAFSADGRVLAGVSYRSPPDGVWRWRKSTLYLWELASGKECLRIPLTDPAEWLVTYQLVVSEDGRTIAATRGPGLQVWDVASGKQLLRKTDFASPPYKLAFAPDGKRVATGHTDGSILVWDLTPHLERRPAPPKPDARAMEEWWAALAGDDAKEAHAAVWALSAAPEHALPLLAKRLQPASSTTAEKLSRLIADLGDDEYARREAASERLAALGEDAEQALRGALKGGVSPEQRRRIEVLLDAPAVAPAAEKLRHLRALQVLERIGTDDARRVVEKLAKGPPPARLSREAKATLDRLGRRAK